MDRNFINLLSLSRIPLSILFVLSILFLENPVSIGIFLCLIIYLTDYYDGKLARSYNLSSNKGAMIDIFSDLFFIVISLYTLYIKNHMPFFIIVVMFAKFVEFCITSYNLNKNDVDIIFFKYDNFGRFVAVLFYILPLFTLVMFALFGYDTGYYIVWILCVLITLSSIVSSILRIRFMYKK